MRSAVFALLSLFVLTFCSKELAAQDPSVWTDFDIKGDIAYLLRKSPSQVMRYDLAEEEWLDPISFEDIPISIAIDDTHLFVAYDRSVKRYDLDGSNETHVTNTSSTILDLLIDGTVLFVSQDSSLYIDSASYNKSTFAEIDTFENYVAGIAGPSLAPSKRKIFGRSRGYSPSDINYLEYDADGNFIGSGESPYHGDYPGASRTWTFPDDSKVADDSGTVYNTADLTYNNSFGAQLTALAFYGNDVPIALIEDTLYSYSNTLLETGSYALTVPSPKDIVVVGEKVIVFYEDSTLPTKVGVTSVLLTDLGANEPGEAISPIDLPYEIDDTTIDSDGILYLLSKAHSSLFRWDTVDQQYIETIALPDACTIIEYSPSQNRLFLYAPPRKIYLMDLDEASPTPTHFINVPLQIDTLLPMGSDLLALANGSWDSQWLYDQDGTLLNSSITCCYHDYHAYDESSNTLYYDNYQVDYLGNGEFGEPQSAGQYGFNPIALSPDGKLFINENGIIFGASSREQIDVLSNDIQAALWNSSKTLFTVEKPAYDDPQRESQSILQKWSEYNAIDGEAKLEGLFVDAHMHDDKITIVTTLNGTPRFNVLTSDLGIAAPTAIEPPNLAVEKYSATAATLTWSDVFGEQSYILERKADNGAWATIATIAFGNTRYTDVTLTTGKTYSFRLKAINGSISSNYSAAVSIDLTSVVDTRIDPRTIYFIPDDELLGENDILYLLSKENQSIFTWDARTCEWGVTIPLEGQPNSFTYSPINNALYTSYPDGKIYSISLAAENPVEILFADDTNENVTTVIAAGRFLASYSSSGSFTMHDATGTLVESSYYHYNIAGGVWNQSTHKIYHLRDGISPNDLLWDQIEEDGTIGEQKDSPYHDSTGIQHPVRVNPQGSVVILGSGRIYQASTLEQIDVLSTSHIDAIWIDGRLYTLKEGKLIAWNLTAYTEYKSITLDDTGSRIFSTQEGQIVLVSKNQDQIFLDLIDSELETIEKASPSAPSSLRTEPHSGDGIRITWDDVTGETGYMLERSSDGNNWEQVTTTDKNVTAAADTNAQVGNTYHYRVKALFSASDVVSPVLQIQLTAPDQVEIPSLTPLSESAIRIEWSESANAIGYKIERSTDGTSWYLVDNLGSNARSYEDTDLYRGTTYHYRITAIGMAGLADPSASANASTLIDPPSNAPDYLDVFSVSALQAEIRWGWSYDAAGYRLERSKEGGDWIVIGEFPYNGETYTDKDLEPETSYRYRVFGYNNGGDSPANVSPSITTLALSLPSSPTLLTYQLSTNEVAIKWSAVSEATSYTIYRRNEGSTSWGVLTTVDRFTIEYIDDTVRLGNAFEYTVTAGNDVGESARSETSATTINNIATVLALDFEEDSDLSEITFSGYLETNPDSPSGRYVGFYYSPIYLYIMPLDLDFGGSISFDIFYDSIPPNRVTLQYWDTTTQSYKTFHTLDINSDWVNTWQNVQVQIPEEAASDYTMIAIGQEDGYSYSNINIDNLLVYTNIPDAPEAPPVVTTSANPAGGIALFWLPSERSRGFRIERSTDSTNWETIAELGRDVSHYIDEEATGAIAYYYRVFSLNTGGDSTPVTTSSFEPNDEVANAYQAGIESVTANPKEYGLQKLNTVSNVYFEVAQDVFFINGDLLTIPWTVYRSEDLINWTRHKVETSVSPGEEDSEGSHFFRFQPGD
ncbi:fibronectin type III domain-containing protein [Pelagicoccus albus]|uniref:Fibronectin type III domain-containing protein n=1 Tax=Pelagicoccus albus TaxID=415222 RepID=A0A7X1B8Z5_9BACT|nr:fibronectin type III domain-containing protein [Pelagicoccus albus]MBC2606583.1 fibronectin type III domain-containing protein [Pelagicoccus albus]